MSAAVVPFRVLTGGRKSTRPPVASAAALPLLTQKLERLDRLRAENPALADVVDHLIDRFLDP